MKFALVSHALPPECSGQAMVIYRLVHSLSPGEYCLISRDHNPEAPQDTYTHRLACKYYHLPSDELIRRGSRWGLARLRRRFNLLPAIILRGRKIAQIIRREECDAVIACTGDLLDLPAAYLASRMVKVPFYPYIFDHYSYRECGDAVLRFAANCLEPTLLKRATKVIVTNGVLQEELRKQYGIEAKVIHNACDLSEYEISVTDEATHADDQIRIVYTGNIYEAHYDAVQNLLTAIESLGTPDLKLHVYTPFTQAQLAARGIRGPIVCHKQEALTSMPGIQQNADVLFLPLAFNSPFPGLVRTSATGKLGEYLAARRPILVHAPPDSFPARYSREHECGVVVDENNPAKLAEAIKQLLSDGPLRQKISENARARAQADFSISTAQSKFLSVINSHSQLDHLTDCVEA